MGRHAIVPMILGVQKTGMPCLRTYLHLSDEPRPHSKSNISLVVAGDVTTAAHSPGTDHPWLNQSRWRQSLLFALSSARSPAFRSLYMLVFRSAWMLVFCSAYMPVLLSYVCAALGER